MSYVLIRFDGNWSDEFDLYGFQVFEKGAWEEIVEGLKACAPNSFQDVYFGTNEAMYWENAEDYLNSLEVTEITDDEAVVLKKLFGSGEFGYTFIDRILERQEEYDDDDVDELIEE